MTHAYTGMVAVTKQTPTIGNSALDGDLPLAPLGLPERANPCHSIKNRAGPSGCARAYRGAARRLPGPACGRHPEGGAEGNCRTVVGRQSTTAG